MALERRAGEGEGRYLEASSWSAICILYILHSISSTVYHCASVHSLHSSDILYNILYVQGMDNTCYVTLSFFQAEIESTIHRYLS